MKLFWKIWSEFSHCRPFLCYMYGPITVNILEYLKEAQYTPPSTVNYTDNLKFKLINFHFILYGIICVNWQPYVSLQKPTHSIGKIEFDIDNNLEVMQTMGKTDPWYKVTGFPNLPPFVLGSESLSSDTTSPSEVWCILKPIALQLVCTAKRNLLNPENLKVSTIFFPNIAHIISLGYR